MPFETVGKRSRLVTAAVIAFAAATLVTPATTIAQEPDRVEAAEAPPAPSSPTAESAKSAVAGPDPEDVFFQAYWDKGVRYRLLGQLKLIEWKPGEPLVTREPLLIGSIGFKLHLDAAAFAKADGLQGVSGGFKVRRSFLNFGGVFFNEIWPVHFYMEFGAVTSSFYFSEGYLMLTDLPYFGSFKIGQYTAPLSLDAIISSRDRTFMESAGPVTAFSLGTRVGLQIADYSHEKKMTWAFGWFADGQNVDVGEASDSLARLVGRMTWTPVDDRDSGVPRLVHLGIASSFLFTGNNVRYQSRPESFVAPVAIDTGDLDSNQALVVGTEAAFVYGSVAGQFEYLQASAFGGDTGTVSFPGVYVSLASFLTGESRPYDREQGRFTQVIPTHELSIRNRTWGALEYAGRYSFTSLDSGPVGGGKMHNLALGVDWYWNRYIRWQFNYIFSDIDGGSLDGILNTFQMRFQLVI